MNADTRSLWAVDDPSRKAIPLVAGTHCDVCVVGGGIAGLTTAYLLGCEGKRVLVLDAKPVLASGETERTTAHLAWSLDDTFSQLVSVRGETVARLAAHSHRAAIDLIEEIARTETIDCDFMRVHGYLFPGKDGPDTLRSEEKTLRQLGLPFEASHFTFPSGQKVECLRFPDHAQFHPLKYLSRLAEAIRGRGGIIHTQTVVEKVRGGNPCRVVTTHGLTITADAVVIATNNPFESGTEMHTKVASYNTYAIAAEVPKGAEYGLYWDTEEPYHYIRYQPGLAFDYLIVGGEDHKTGQADDQPQRWDRLLDWAKERYPALGAVRYHWSGQVFETLDGLAYIGLAPWNGPNVYLMTGDSGMGMTHGTLGARLVTDLVMGRPNEWASVYSPSRLTPLAMGTLLGENLNLMTQFTDWVTGGDVKSEQFIPPGHGAVIRQGLSKLAVYKDDAGKTTKLSAVCPHMGCIVHWNAGERTWDCPCHGSRYTGTGTCIHGPSTSDLKPAG